MIRLLRLMRSRLSASASLRPRAVAIGTAVSAALIGIALSFPAVPVAGSGEEAEIVLKDGTVVQGTILQELPGRVKIETFNNEVRSIDRADIVEIRRAPNLDSRVVEILGGIDRLLDGQQEILDRLEKGAGTAPRSAAPAERGASAGADAARRGATSPPSPAAIREALGEPESVAKDCFVGTPAAGPNPFASERWTYAPGAGGLRSDERRALFFVNGVFVGSIVEGAGGVLRPDSGFGSLIGSDRR